VAALTTLIWRSWTSRMTQVPGVGSSEADVVQTAVVAQGHRAGLVDAVVPNPLVGVGVRGRAWQRFRHRLVERGRGGAVGQGSVRASVVVLAGEVVEERLKFGDRGRLDWLGA